MSGRGRKKASAPYEFDAGAGADVEALAARVRESAAGGRVASSEGARDEGDGASLAPVESVIQAQAEFNRSVGEALRLVARHLLYLRVNFEALEDGERRGPRPDEPTGLERDERVEHLSRALESVRQSVEALAAGLSELSERTERELGELRRSVEALRRPAEKPKRKRR